MSDNSGSAFPESYIGTDMPHEGIGGGLTKRELFAAMAMQGLLSNLASIRREGFRDREIEEFAVIRADALIAALEAK